MRLRLIALAISFAVVAAGQTVESYAIRTVVGNGLKQANPALDVDTVPGLEANLEGANGLAVDSAGRLYFSDRNAVLRYDPVTKAVTRIAGQFTRPQQGPSFSGDGGLARGALLDEPAGLVFDRDGRLVVADTFNHRIRRISGLQTDTPTIETIGGTGANVDSGDGGPMARASFRFPIFVAYAANGSLFVGEPVSYRLRIVGPDGVLEPSVGPGINRCDVRGAICIPSSMAGDGAGNVLLAEGGWNQLLAIGPDRKVAVVAGKEPDFSGAFSGDGGPASQAKFWWIGGVAIDRLKNIFLSDSGNQRIRRITADGIIRTIAGTGKGGTVGAYGGDDGPALEADLASPWAVAADAQGNIYFSDSSNRRIRVLVPCTLTLGANSATFDSLGGEGELAVSSNERGCRWTATSDASWLTLGQDASGLGTGKFTIRIAPNPTNATRTANIRIAGKTVAVTQLGPGTVFPRLTSAAHAATFSSGVVAGAWMALTGTNLSATTRTWSDGDFTGGRLPTALDGVSVKVGGLDAYVYFVSATQLNVLVPNGVAAGPVLVEVTNRVGKATLTAEAKRLDPGFFLVTAPVNGKALSAAVHADGVLVGEVGSIPGAATRPARPGDAIVVFGTGFGPTNPVTPDGVAGAPPAALANPLTIFVGGQKAQIDFAGVVGPGLVQVNLRVPEFLPTGRHSMVAAIGGVESPIVAAIAVE